MTSGDSFMPIRVGFYQEPTMEEDANQDQIVRNVFTAGIGLIMQNIILDAAIEWARSSYVMDRTLNGGDITYNGNDIRITVGGVFHFGEK